jgi:hypothetical protein
MEGMLVPECSGNAREEENKGNNDGGDDARP